MAESLEDNVQKVRIDIINAFLKLTEFFTIGAFDDLEIEQVGTIQFKNLKEKMKNSMKKKNKESNWKIIKNRKSYQFFSFKR